MTHGVCYGTTSKYQRKFDITLQYFQEKYENRVDMGEETGRNL